MIILLPWSGGLKSHVKLEEHVKLFVVSRPLKHEPHDSKHEACKAQNLFLFCVEH
jgi:hypothetical protein